MVTVKISDQIRSSRTIKGFRSLRHYTGVPLATLDAGRRSSGDARRRWCEERDCWQSRQKASYLIRIGAACSARSRSGSGIDRKNKRI
jgi:hypothetical protein